MRCTMTLPTNHQHDLDGNDVWATPKLTEFCDAKLLGYWMLELTEFCGAKLPGYWMFELLERKIPTGLVGIFYFNL